jgi:hypothetical protein
MEVVFTVIGYLCCIFLVGLMISALFTLCKNFIVSCFKNEGYTIRNYKKDIDISLYETKKAGYKIMFRNPECKAYEMYNIHIATQGDEEIIVIDLF